MSPPSMRRALLIRCGFGIGVLLCILCSSIYVLVRVSLYGEIDDSIQQTAAILSNQVELENDTITYEWQEGLGTNRNLIEGALFQFWDEKTASTTRSPGLRWRDLPKYSGVDGSPLLRNIELSDGHHARAVGLRIYPFVLPEEVEAMKLRGEVIDPSSLPQILVVARDAEPTHRALARLRWVLATGSLVTLGVGFLLIDRAIRASLRPIDQLSAQVQDRAGHQLDAALDLPEDLPLELTGLATNFDLLVLRPGQGWGPSASPLFSRTDVEMIRQQVPGIKAISPMSNTNVQAIHQEAARLTDVQGVYPEYFPIGNWTIATGRFFDETELNDGAAVAVIGETIKKELFNGRDPIGEKIRLLNTAVTVVGVTAIKGQGGWGDDLDDNIIIPITTLQRRLNGQMFKQNVNQIMVSAQDGYPTDGVIADITSLMRERRNLPRSEANNFSVTDTRQIADAVSSSTKVMTSLLGAVAGVSLLVGGIGIMNIMLVSVTERTREIGIRMAIGARAREVLLQFLVEAVTLSCVGGLSGIALAYGLCVSLAKVVGAPFLFDPKINTIALVFSAAIGIFFGFMPARRAAALDPIDALRHE